MLFEKGSSFHCSKIQTLQKSGMLVM